MLMCDIWVDQPHGVLLLLLMIFFLRLSQSSFMKRKSQFHLFISLHYCECVHDCNYSASSAVYLYFF